MLTPCRSPLGAALLLALAAAAAGGPHRDVTKFVPVGVDAPSGGATAQLSIMVPTKGAHPVANPKDLRARVDEAWTKVVEPHQAGLVDPKQMHLAAAALSSEEAWHHYQAGQSGVLDSARFLVTFGMVPAVQSGGSPLHIAAATGNTAAIARLLDDGADVNEENAGDGTTPLHHAVTTCQVPAVRLLLEREANAEAAARSGATPLHMAAAMGCEGAAAALLDSGADPDYKHPFAGTSALHFAAEMGRTGVMRLLCRRGADPNTEKRTGGTPLHTAADANQSAAVEALIGDCKVSTNKLLMGDTTPLYLAAQRGLTEVARVLLDHGAELNYAMPRGKFKMALQPQGNAPPPGAFYDEKNTEVGNGATALHAAVENGHPEVVQLLLDRGALQLASMEGASPLVIALQYRHPGIALQLLQGADCEHAAKVNTKVPVDGASPLFVAAGYNYAAVVKRLLECGADPNIRNRHGATPLSHALRYGLRVVADALLEAGADPAAVMGSGHSMLDAAIDGGHLAAVEAVLKADPGLALRRNADGRTALHTAAERGNSQAARRLIELGADLSARVNSTGATPLFLAAMSGDEGLVALLIDRGADVHARAGRALHWATPLFVAAQGGKKEACRALLGAGARPDAALHGMHVTPLIAAAERGHPEVVALLLDSGAQVGTRDKRGWTALTAAAGAEVAGRTAEVARVLLGRGAAVDTPDASGASPLLRAVRSPARNHEMIKLLLEHGAGLAAQDYSGQGLLHAVATGRRPDAEPLAMRLLRDGAPPGAPDRNGSTPLHVAAAAGQIGISEALVKAGAPLDARRSTDGRTPLHLAVGEGHARLSGLLARAGADPEAQDSGGRTALDLARSRRDFALLRELTGEAAQAEQPEARGGLFAEADRNADGELSRSEVARAARNSADFAAALGLRAAPSAPDLERAFQALDADRSRGLSHKELQAAASRAPSDAAAGCRGGGGSCPAAAEEEDELDD
eukprot:TRINITY_DN27906_c0_g1_i1.p1 TRINITY_DN27906_c0_g1~~TRINITY_DN27906_c0_g1_i1.p1  ORF type:complete len:1010 (+),score=361.76 TRINITY_DN27906_c0_g1_i1:97-3030(+)